MKSQFIGKSKKVGALLKLIDRVGSSNTNVLIIGESGTGKELIAKLIHEKGENVDRPFVAINCGAIPENLIESELFGHKKGSFTGAVQDKAGLFEAASGGTLFLDEVGELPLGMQVKLLRAIQERVIRRVGSNDHIKINVRIIAATNRDLEAAVSAGSFREDLYYRLNVILVDVPSLRERIDDVEELAHFFLERYAKKMNREISGFQPEVLEALQTYYWPGNVRELENVIERASTLETESLISMEVLPPSLVQNFKDRKKGDGHTPVEKEIRLPAPDFTRGSIVLDKVLMEVERKYILAALEYSNGTKKKAAELLGLTFRSFRYRLGKQGLDDSS